MRALVTGADGFVGQWLLRALLDAGDEVTGTIREASPALTTLDESSAQRVRWVRADLADQAALERALADADAEAVYHLAAQPSVAASFEKPAETFDANVMGTLHLLEACRKRAPGSKFLFVGSSEVYGAPAGAEPIREDAPLLPQSPYASSKAAAEAIALQYARSQWLSVVATRSFNHTGPGQSGAFAVTSFAKQIAEVKAGRRPPKLAVGNLSPRRDYTDVRDVVAAYRLLVERGETARPYNVCSGRSMSMREIVDDLLTIAGVDASVETDPALVRPIDAALIVGDNSALARDTGWRPNIPLVRTLSDVFEFCATRRA